MQLPIPEHAQQLLDQIPAEFVDDGCSNSPDTWLRFDFRWVCRIHDWRGCSRAWPAGSRTLDEMHAGNAELWALMGDALPWRHRWVRWLYYAVLARFNGDVAWDSCGRKPLGVTAVQKMQRLCRHNMSQPDWMTQMRRDYF